MTIGRKDDGMNGTGEMKQRYDLIDDYAEEAMVDVLTDGAKVYGDNNWRLVENAEARYFGALRRHLKSYRQGQLRCPKSGRLNLAHAMTNCMFLLALQMERLRREEAKQEAAKCEYATNVAEFMAAVEKEESAAEAAQSVTEVDAVAGFDAWWKKAKPEQSIIDAVLSGDPHYYDGGAK